MSPGLTIQQAFEKALAQQQAGKLHEAEALYRQILAQQPRLAEVHNNLGNALKAMGRIDEAGQSYRNALAIRRDIPQIHNNLGTILHEQGAYEQAMAEYREALTLKPAYPEALYNQGNTLQKLGRSTEAVASYREAISHWPSYAEAHYNLGNAHSALSHREEAIAAFRHAVWLRPNYPDAWNNLGNELATARRYGEAAAAYKQAIAQRQADPHLWNNLGNALRESGRQNEAIDAYRQALSMRRDFAEALYNMGIAFGELGRLDEAIETYRHAWQTRPNFADAYHNLAIALKDAGQLEEALSCYRRALSLKPDSKIAGNLAYTLNFIEEDPRKIREETRRWNERFAKPLLPAAPTWDNERLPDRRLRIGYVSPDFREHPVGRFMLPLLANHDRTRFEIFCYTDLIHADWLTEKIKPHVDMWRGTIDLSDEQLARQIRQDRIDVLVDLTMHMRGSRLMAFARKPAPVQVAYLAYCGTTGLEAMDYRLTDPHLDPQSQGDGRDDAIYCEKSVSLPQTYWCYEPSAAAPEPGPLPALAAGYVTFGCLNNFSKVSRKALNTWAEVLRAVPDSRLIICSPEGRHRQGVRDLLRFNGVEPSRIEFVGLLFPLEKYLERYQRIDIALDPFPYPGGTTSLDALWMGVPVVTLAGQTAISRSGVSILSNLSRLQWIGHTAEQYVEIATRLAADPAALGAVRQSLREKLRSSPLMNAPQFARDIEAAYRQMWKSCLLLNV
ncbi:MAG TPA: tetratricopeptide repeat protein [Tepidisphaeraceae bacterium]|nr:tetratricopeptide repeat protein [Tepidisphaeraceae bacterium]